MLIKVKTLTGKEIEIDIEPTDKVFVVLTEAIAEVYLVCVHITDYAN